ncbi:MAG: hypothetical protein FWC80_04700 [Firmicutes bacterium]|nr:hypothetical protein [Bacillota bacterium]
MINNSELRQMYINLIKQLDEQQNENDNPESEQKILHKLYELMQGDNAKASYFIYNEGFKLGLLVGLESSRKN